MNNFVKLKINQNKHLSFLDGNSLGMTNPEGQAGHPRKI
jgi:hypothetical protein